MNEAEPSQLVKVIERLLEHNWSLGERDVSPQDGVSQAALALLYGLQAHAFSLAEATLGLWERPGLRVAALPLTRAIFETGVTAQWVAQDPEAAGGLIAAFAEHRRKLASNLEKVTGPVADALPGIRTAIPDVISDKRGTAERFVNLTAQFVNGDELYAYYRILCGQTHAGVEVADQWITLDRAGIPRFLPEPEVRVTQDEILAIYGLLLAASAFEASIKADGPDITDFLRSVAREVGVQSTLSLKTRNTASAKNEPSTDA